MRTTVFGALQALDAPVEPHVGDDRLILPWRLAQSPPPWSVDEGHQTAYSRFADDRVVFDAGIVLAATLAQRGIEGLVPRFVRLTS